MITAPGVELSRKNSRERHKGIECQYRTFLCGPGCPGTPSVIQAGIKSVRQQTWPKIGPRTCKVVLELWSSCLFWSARIMACGPVEKQVLMGWLWQLGFRQVKFPESASNIWWCISRQWSEAKHSACMQVIPAGWEAEAEGPSSRPSWITYWDSTSGKQKGKQTVGIQVKLWRRVRKTTGLDEMTET